MLSVLSRVGDYGSLCAVGSSFKGTDTEEYRDIEGRARHHLANIEQWCETFYNVVKEFAESLPYQVKESNKKLATLSCRYCSAEVRYVSGDSRSLMMDPQQHDEFCLWRRANQLITEENL